MLELKHISKIFPGVKALDDVSLTFLQGEIHALMGENGSGKSTLMKIITGIYQPDIGEKEEGLMLDFSVRTNISITIWSRILNQFRKISVKKEKTAASFMADKMNINTPSMDTSVGSLSGGNQQKVSIGKWLAAACDILIIDEPTAGGDVGAKNIYMI